MNLLVHLSHFRCQIVISRFVVAEINVQVSAVCTPSCRVQLYVIVTVIDRLLK